MMPGRRRAHHAALDVGAQIACDTAWRLAHGSSHASKRCAAARDLELAVDLLVESTIGGLQKAALAEPFRPSVESMSPLLGRERILAALPVANDVR